MNLARPSVCLLALAGSLLAASACDSDDTGGEFEVPRGVTCARSISGGANGADLTAALAGAQAGDCVFVGVEGTLYEGSFTVPADVKLVGDASVGPAEIRGV